MKKKANLVVAAFLLIVGAALAQHIDYAPFGHYTERVTEFEKQPRIMPTDIVMLGDSHTEFGGDWNKRLPGCGNIVNRGIAGDDAIGIGHRLKQICPYKPKTIVLECGINDLSHALTPQRDGNRSTERPIRWRSLTICFALNARREVSPL